MNPLNMMSNSRTPESMAFGRKAIDTLGPMEPNVLGSLFGGGGQGELERMMNERKLQDMMKRQMLMDMLAAATRERSGMKMQHETPTTPSWELNF
jgi:hypothetical protein